MSLRTIFEAHRRAKTKTYRDSRGVRYQIGAGLPIIRVSKKLHEKVAPNGDNTRDRIREML